MGNGYDWISVSFKPIFTFLVGLVLSKIVEDCQRDACKD